MRKKSNPITPAAFARDVLARLNATGDLSALLAATIEATHGEIYIFGGTVRRTLLGCDFGCDLDIMVPNHDNRVFDCLAALGVPYSLNRRGHHRYQWKGLQLDVNQPKEWRKDFGSVCDVLRYFDLRINSLAIHVGSYKVLDPFGVLSGARPATPGINWERWMTMPPLEFAILAIRLHAIMTTCPSLAISSKDAARLQRLLRRSLRAFDWSLVRERFPSGRAMFLQSFEQTVLARAGTA